MKGVNSRQFKVERENPKENLPGLDLLNSSDMLLQSLDKQMSPDCPGPGEQAHRQNSGTTENIEVHVGLRAGARLVQEVCPGQEEHGR
jgi:hypothetical protein